jgi:hypothetical protein
MEESSADERLTGGRGGSNSQDDFILRQKKQIRKQP